MLRRPGTEVAFHPRRVSLGNSTPFCGEPVDNAHAKLPGRSISIDRPKARGLRAPSPPAWGVAEYIFGARASHLDQLAFANYIHSPLSRGQCFSVEGDESAAGARLSCEPPAEKSNSGTKRS
jgi:hypothetical protein